MYTKLVFLLLICSRRIEKITKYLDVKMYHPVIHKHVKIPDKYEIGTSYLVDMLISSRPIWLISHLSFDPLVWNLRKPHGSHVSVAISWTSPSNQKGAKETMKGGYFKIEHSCLLLAIWLVEKCHIPYLSYYYNIHDKELLSYDP
jgi:hypothetical protein